MYSPLTVSVVVIDDEMSAILLLEEMLTKIDGVSIAGHATDVNGGINLILSHRPGIVFLDIRFEGETGFDLIKALKDYDLNPFIVMVTGYDKFAIEAIKAGAFDYLLKPVDPEDLLKVISRFRHKQTSLQNQNPGISDVTAEHIKKIRFNTLGGFILINPQDIIYCKAEANYTDLFLIDNRKHTISQNIGRIEEILTPPTFFRISRSIIINMKYLTEINRGKRICTLNANHATYPLTISHDRIKDLEKAFVQ